MEYMETELLLSLPGPTPSFWVRYIDDVLIQWKHTMEEFHIFLDKLNNLESLINFTTEMETPHPSIPGHASMPFLDLLIHRTPGSFIFSIYRKPTASESYTHYNSSHSDSSKRGVIMSLVIRAKRLCSDEHVGAEINHIRSVFLRLQYPLSFINSSIAAGKHRFHNPRVKESHRTSYHLSLPSHPALMDLRPSLRKIGISTSFSSSNTLRNQLSRTGPAPTPELETPGVYRVDCRKCPEVYFGETGRNIKKRRYDHAKDIREANASNALFVHMQNNPGHSFNLKDMNLVYKSNKKSSRQLVESALITASDNCNLKPGDFPVCRLVAPVVIEGLKLQTIIENATCPPLPTTVAHRSTTGNPSPALPTPANPLVHPPVPSAPLVSSSPIGVAPSHPS